MDIDFDADNQDEIVRTVKRLSELMRERNIDLAKAKELICGGRIDNNGKADINWIELTDEFQNEERGNTAFFYPREWGEDAFHQWSPEKIDFYLKEGTK